MGSVFSFIAVCMGCCVMGHSQNLIKNPSFEEYTDCPKNLGNFETDVAFWTTPTEGSTDYFNGCSEVMGTPKNFNGVQPADFGTGYAGFYMYAPNDYREYIQAELTQTLVKGAGYDLSFYVSLAERSDFAIREFGVLFSDRPLKIATKRELSKKLLYQERENTYYALEIGYPDFYSDTREWVLVHTRFEAKGTEKYLILGNFKSNARTRMVKTKKNAKQGAYYYVDMVILEAVGSGGPLHSKPPHLDFEPDRAHVFNNVFFAFDESTVLEDAKRELDLVAKYLKEHPQFKIMINGHTDSVGSASYNQELSDHRAAAVAKYLRNSGLDGERIFWQGYGGTLPVASNDTEEGRRQNRRVEFVITKI